MRVLLTVAVDMYVACCTVAVELQCQWLHGLCTEHARKTAAELQDDPLHYVAHSVSQWLERAWLQQTYNWVDGKHAYKQWQTCPTALHRCRTTVRSRKAQHAASSPIAWAHCEEYTNRATRALVQGAGLGLGNSGSRQSACHAGHALVTVA
jgi:hypothetical protein